MWFIGMNDREKEMLQPVLNALKRKAK